MKVRILSIRPASDSRFLIVEFAWDNPAKEGWALAKDKSEIPKAIAQSIENLCCVEARLKEAETLVGQELEV